MSAARRNGVTGARATKAILERENDMVSGLAEKSRFRRSEAQVIKLRIGGWLRDY